jgi:Protein of unknown function (DUF2530)
MSSMSESDTSGPAPAPEPPPLPSALLEPWPVIAVGAALWLAVTVLAFTVPSIETWRPISIAGLGTGVLGTSIFLWQRSAARRGARGAQTGLTLRGKRRET